MSGDGLSRTSTPWPVCVCRGQPRHPSIPFLAAVGTENELESAEREEVQSASDDDFGAAPIAAAAAAAP